MAPLPLLAPGYYSVFLENLRRHVKLGVLPHETRPQPVSVSIAVVVARVGEGDGIEDVVDYDSLRSCVSALTAERHFGLQETLCEAIIEDLMARPHIFGVAVETRKLAVYDDAAAVGCAMSRFDPKVLFRV
ncbi:MAG: dihydroneopterin aldolase [Parvularcula sp.]|jgi:dihydroneopterin aldolase|nr:dihydroneopterin aldolase [Parvularcula sp.]